MNDADLRIVHAFRSKNYVLIDEFLEDESLRKRMVRQLYLCTNIHILYRILKHPEIRKHVTGADISRCLETNIFPEYVYIVIEMLIALDSPDLSIDPDCTCNESDESIHLHVHTIDKTDERFDKFNADTFYRDDSVDKTYLSMCYRYIARDNHTKAALYIMRRLPPPFCLLLSAILSENLQMVKHYTNIVAHEPQRARFFTPIEYDELTNKALCTMNYDLIEYLIKYRRMRFTPQNIVAYRRIRPDILDLALDNCTELWIDLNEFSKDISNETLEYIVKRNRMTFVDYDTETLFTYAVCTMSKRTLYKLLQTHNPNAYRESITHHLKNIQHITCRFTSICRILMRDGRIGFNFESSRLFSALAIQQYYIKHQKIIAVNIAFAFMKYPVLVQYEIFKHIIDWIPAKKRLSMFVVWEIMKIPHVAYGNHEDSACCLWKS